MDWYADKGNYHDGEALTDGRPAYNYPQALPSVMADMGDIARPRPPPPTPTRGRHPRALIRWIIKNPIRASWCILSFATPSAGGVKGGSHDSTSVGSVDRIRIRYRSAETRCVNSPPCKSLRSTTGVGEQGSWTGRAALKRQDG